MTIIILYFFLFSFLLGSVLLVIAGKNPIGSSHPIFQLISHIFLVIVPKIFNLFGSLTCFNFRKLMNGQYGLAKTFWLFGVLVQFIFQLIMNMSFYLIGYSALLLIIFSTLLIAYSICQLIGLWRAAELYSGLSLWVLLSKIYIVFGFIMMPISFLTALWFLNSL